MVKYDDTKNVTKTNLITILFPWQLFDVDVWTYNVLVETETVNVVQTYFYASVTSNAIESIEEEDEEEEEEETQPGESEQIPLVRGDSEESRRGYHTPTPATPRGFHTPISEPSAPPSPVRPTLPPILPLGAPSSQGGPPSPSSALMTVSLDAYLEPRRISFESPPSSDLLPRAQSPEESYPVFSPPPIRRRHTVASPSLLQRTSIISQSSRAEPHSHHTCNYRFWDSITFTPLNIHRLLSL